MLRVWPGDLRDNNVHALIGSERVPHLLQSVGQEEVFSSSLGVEIHCQVVPRVHHGRVEVDVVFFFECLDPREERFNVEGANVDFVGLQPSGLPNVKFNDVQGEFFNTSIFSQIHTMPPPVKLGQVDQQGLRELTFARMRRARNEDGRALFEGHVLVEVWPTRTHSSPNGRAAGMINGHEVVSSLLSKGNKKRRA